jgi:hypothetical protein
MMMGYHRCFDETKKTLVFILDSRRVRESLRKRFDLEMGHAKGSCTARHSQSKQTYVYIVCQRNRGYMVIEGNMCLVMISKEKRPATKSIPYKNLPERGR